MVLMLLNNSFYSVAVFIIKGVFRFGFCCSAIAVRR